MRGLSVCATPSSAAALAELRQRGGVLRVASGAARRVERLDRILRLAGQRHLAPRAVQPHPGVDLGSRDDRLGAPDQRNPGRDELAGEERVGPPGEAVALVEVQPRRTQSTQVEEQVGETPVCYFLFSAVPDLRVLRPLARDIRFSASGLMRFAPMVYCAENPSVETIVACINMGFDDIVALPQTAPRLRARLARQIDRNMVFYETPGYFGPDRRNRVKSLSAPRPQSRGAGPFRRLEIVRDVCTGVSVLRDEFLPSSAAVAAMQTLQQSA